MVMRGNVPVFGNEGAIQSSIRSLLLPSDEMPVEVVHALKMRTIEYVEGQARQAKPTARLTTRALLPTDLGLTNNAWTETSGSANAYASTTIADKEIADDAWIGIWGVRMFTPASTDDNNDSAETMENILPAISVIRIDVGGARVHQWDLFPILHVMAYDVAESHIFRPIIGMALSPVIVGPNKSITVTEYSTLATAEYTLGFEGVIVEVEGKTIRA